MTFEKIEEGMQSSKAATQAIRIIKTEKPNFAQRVKNKLTGADADNRLKAEEYVEKYNDEAEKMLLEHGRLSAIRYVDNVRRA